MTVTKKQLANLRPIQKGEVRNPLGARAHNKELKKIRSLTVEEVARVGELILQNDLTALEALRDKPGSSVLTVWICAIAVKAIRKGDAMALNALLDRFIGKVPNQVVLTGTLRASKAPVDLTKLSTDELSELEGILKKAEPSFQFGGGKKAPE